MYTLIYHLPLHNENMPFPVHRPRRLRVSESMRRLVRETHLEPGQLVLPLFVCPGEGVRSRGASYGTSCFSQSPVARG